MAVYVDTMRAPYGRMKMCHMIADSRQELVRMADQIGVNRRWIQCAGTHREHFDISLGKRKLAVEAGAIEISRFQLGKKLMDRRMDRRDQHATSNL